MPVSTPLRATITTRLLVVVACSLAAVACSIGETNHLTVETPSRKVSEVKTCSGAFAKPDLATLKPCGEGKGHCYAGNKTSVTQLPDCEGGERRLGARRLARGYAPGHLQVRQGVRSRVAGGRESRALHGSAALGRVHRSLLREDAGPERPDPARRLRPYVGVLAVRDRQGSGPRQPTRTARTHCFALSISVPKMVRHGDEQDAALSGVLGARGKVHWLAPSPFSESDEPASLGVGLGAPDALGVSVADAVQAAGERTARRPRTVARKVLIRGASDSQP